MGHSQKTKLILWNFLYLVKIFFLVLLLLSLLLLFYSWARYTKGSSHFDKIVQGKTISSLSRVTWVHPARKVIIEYPDILSSFVDTIKRSSPLEPESITFDDHGHFVFEFNDGSYFTLWCKEKWSPRENELILAYRPWSDNDMREWQTRKIIFADYPECFKNIHEFFNAPCTDDSMFCHQTMFIDTAGNTEFIKTNRLYRSNEYRNYLDFWGEGHYRLGFWLYLLLGTFALLVVVITIYLLIKCHMIFRYWYNGSNCPTPFPPSKNKASNPQTDQF